MSAQYVRFLLKQGDADTDRLAEAPPEQSLSEPPSLLVGERHPSPRGSGVWMVPVEELQG